MKEMREHEANNGGNPANEVGFDSPPSRLIYGSEGVHFPNGRYIEFVDQIETGLIGGTAATFDLTRRVACDCGCTVSSPTEVLACGCGNLTCQAHSVQCVFCGRVACTGRCVDLPGSRRIGGWTCRDCYAEVSMPSWLKILKKLWGEL